MSYIHMDHAGWVERNIAASKKGKPTAKDRRATADGKGWFAAPDQLNPFQRRAFDILGIVGGGIYNAPLSWDSLRWHPTFITCAWFNGLGTWDFKGLTQFVFLCHEARIRGHISPLAPRHMEISLHERKADGGVAREHPDLEQAIARWREEFPADHPIRFDAAAAIPPAQRGPAHD